MRRARHFRYAFLLLPSAKRRALSALYTFCRACDDAADTPASPEIRRAALQELRRRLVSPPEGPLWLALSDARRRYGIPQKMLEQILDGVEQDLQPFRCETFEELRRYCYRVAACPGLATLEILGYRDPSARNRAEDLGIAMQLTNILRDLREDASAGRLYFPRQELRRFRVTDLESGDDRARAFFRFQVDRARDYFRRAEPLLSMVPLRCRPFLAALAAIYQEFLRQIEAAGFALFAGKLRIPEARKIRLIASAALGSFGRALKPESATSLRGAHAIAGTVLDPGPTMPRQRRK